jgi:type IV pilus assembly protein PilO
MKKQTFQLLFLILLISSGLIYGYYTYLLAPEWSNIQNVKAQISQKQNRYELLASYQNNPFTLQDELRNLENQKAKLSAQIPAVLDKPVLVVSLYDLAKANSVQPESVTFDSPQTKDGLLAQPLTFLCHGGADNVLATITKLQLDPKYKLALQSVTLTSKEGTLQAEIKLIAYAIKERTAQESGQPSELLNNPVGLGSVSQMF